MPLLTETIGACGPVVDVVLMPDANGMQDLAAAGHHFIKPVKAKLLIDTAA